jgi:hypothetical protein
MKTNKKNLIQLIMTVLVFLIILILIFLSKRQLEDPEKIELIQEQIDHLNTPVKK